jgi:hypothetical protein
LIDTFLCYLNAKKSLQIKLPIIPQIGLESKAVRWINCHHSMIWLYFYFALIFDKAVDQKAVFY